MLMKTKLIRVNTDDWVRARKLGIPRLVEDNPDLDGHNISDSFLYHRMVKYFIED